MIAIENTRVFGFEMAVKGARNPMNSRDQSDSYYPDDQFSAAFVMGEKDLALLTRLSKAGPDHGKFMRMIHVQCDVTAPLYWWKEADQYKVGTTTDSCSTMHKIHAKEFTIGDFSHDQLGDDYPIEVRMPCLRGSRYYFPREVMEITISALNALRVLYLETKEKKYWYDMIQLLPSSYNQMRTWDLDYAVLKNIYWARKDHKLKEWHVLCDWIKTLPYARQLICEEV